MFRNPPPSSHATTAKKLLSQGQQLNAKESWFLSFKEEGENFWVTTHNPRMKSLTCQNHGSKLY